MAKLDLNAIEYALDINATVDSSINWARNIADGSQEECKYVKWACIRFLDDLENGEKRGIRFIRPKAEKVLAFFPMFCAHVEGELAGKPIYLEDWQGFYLINLFGFYQYEYEEQRWVRRFNLAYLEVARKNAKSMLLSGIAIFMMAFDGEEGAQVYTAATKKDQAKIVFDAAAQMVKKSEALSKVIKVHKTHMEVESSFSRCRPLSRDADSLDGLNSHCNIIDELHAHPKRELFDVLLDGTQARLNPLTPIITTAGTNKEGICYEQRSLGINVLDPSKADINNDSYFVLIFTLDDGDDPYDESKWYKANPNLGKSKKIRALRSAAKQSIFSGLARINFMIKHLNIWTDAAVSWLDPIKWEALSGEFPQNIAELPMWIGVDYAPIYDVTAKIQLYADADNDLFYVKTKFYYPQESISSLPPEVESKFRRWEHQGHLITLPGSMTDLDRIEADILQDMSQQNCQEACLDPWNTYQLTSRLMDKGMEAVHVGQTVRNFTEAMKFIEGLILEERIIHDGNPVMNWMMGNVEVKPDLNENIFPRKAGGKKESKIDGPTALFTAMNRAMINGSSDTATPDIRLI